MTSLQESRPIRAAAATVFVIAIFVLIAASVFAQTVPVVTGDARVDTLLSQMTLAEKLTLIHGAQEDPPSTRARPDTSAVFHVSAFRACALPMDRRGAHAPSLAGGNRHHGRGRDLRRETGARQRRRDRTRRLARSALTSRCSRLSTSTVISRSGRAYNTFGEDPC